MIEPVEITLIKIMKIQNAKLSDIKSIMKIERSSFLPNIQEEEKVFLERIKVFPEGFLLFYNDDLQSFSQSSVGSQSATSSQNVAKTLPFLQSSRPLGYFSTELWEKVPSNEDFAVGHDIKKLHSPSGKILYISSFALLPEARGKGNGFLLFNESLRYLEKRFSLEREVLLVNEKWQGAKHIYEKSGFIETQEIVGAFPDSDFGIFMERNV